jgi:PAS domain S-box-containing protein
MGINNDKEPSATTELRRQAEARQLVNEGTRQPPRTNDETQRLVHELEVHQLELEMQNAELTQAREEVATSLDRYTDLFDFAPVGYVTLSRDGTVLAANLTMAKLMGIERSRLLGKRFGLFVADETRLFFAEFLGKVCASEHKESCEVPLTREGNSPLLVQIEAIGLGSGRECHLAVIDITERKRAEDLLRFLGQSGGEITGTGFFTELARYLARVLDVDFVCIDRLEEGRLSAQTLAVFHDGQFKDNVSYTLRDTPCGDVVGQKICCFPQNVRGLFPRDAVLQELQAESYLGATLWNTQGEPIGLIAVIGRRPLADTRQAESILHMVAVRAAGELERRQSEEQIQLQVQELRELNEEMTIFNNAAVERELRMIELKKEINELCARAGLPLRYDLDFTGDLP